MSDDITIKFPCYAAMRLSINEMSLEEKATLPEKTERIPWVTVILRGKNCLAIWTAHNNAGHFLRARGLASASIVTIPDPDALCGHLELLDFEMVAVDPDGKTGTAKIFNRLTLISDLRDG